MLQIVNVRLLKLHVHYVTTKVVTTKVADYQNKLRLKYQTTKRFDYQETTTKGVDDQKMTTNIPATVPASRQNQRVSESLIRLK